MEQWETALLKVLQRRRTVDQAFEAIAKAADDLGFRWCAYGCQHPLPFTRRRIFLISNYAPSWQARYAEAGYLRVDPTVAHARGSLQPVLWNDATFQPAPQLWEEAKASGLRYGWAQACFGPDGSIGLLSLSRDSDSLGRLELRAKQVRLRFLVNVTHATLSPLVRLQQEPQMTSLTPQELQVLRWSADGKSSEATAELMDLSLHTVEFHIKNAVRKLGASSRAAATARAAAIGLLR
ncbi:MAG: LuxR family transcriptional regulator [Comamonadaceae bacterium]|nr:MAG: LuxR family transcriptional regulator [Comamonadaceae bacterium]